METRKIFFNDKECDFKGTPRCGICSETGKNFWTSIHIASEINRLAGRATVISDPGKMLCFKCGTLFALECKRLLYTPPTWAVEFQPRVAGKEKAPRKKDVPCPHPEDELVFWPNNVVCRKCLKRFEPEEFNEELGRAVKKETTNLGKATVETKSYEWRGRSLSRTPSIPIRVKMERSRERRKVGYDSGDGDFSFEMMDTFYGPRFDHGMDHHGFRVFRVDGAWSETAKEPDEWTHSRP